MSNMASHEDDSGSESEIEVVKTDYTNHPAFQALKGHGTFDLQAKRNLLLPFTSKTTLEACFPQTLLQEGSQTRVFIDDFIALGHTEKSRKQNWKATYTASTILALVSLFHSALQADTVSNKPWRLPRVASSFLDKVQPVINEAVAKNVVESSTQRRKHSSLIKQKEHDRVQDKIKYKQAIAMPWQECPNPSCRHHFTAMVEDNREQIKKQKADYQLKLKEWESKPAKDRGSRPTARYADNIIACYCYQQFCMLDPNGIGCESCSNVGAAILADTFHVRDPATGKNVCTCEVCQCSCDIAFAQKNRSRVAEQMQSELESSMGKYIGWVFCTFIVLKSDTTHSNQMVTAKLPSTTSAI